MIPTSSSELRRVRIQATGPTARLEIDDRDIADQVRSYELRHTAGQLPELQLLLRPTAAPEWEGTARVVVGEAPDPGPAAAAFLRALDPAETERAVLARHDLLDGGPHEFTRALLAQLTEWALGVRQPGEHEAVDG
ncbi:hypothetical protein DR950_17900 [Kitasatospora xanthocidica]|uniref:Uncharacterized protein n=1 Tax=Kitasatospora xanthocidica TaxID=83382 RepID=A0A372ZVT1_9ACTN|nr:hypothetical protein [Kitasatospora xanthocidica]RGD59417.1 hypothetical protein DR950_17900 [Kitasatospora xanthocidica]